MEGEENMIQHLLKVFEHLLEAAIPKIKSMVTVQGQQQARHSALHLLGWVIHGICLCTQTFVYVCGVFFFFAGNIDSAKQNQIFCGATVKLCT